MTSILLAVATRKGLWFYRSTDRRTWTVDGPHHFGSIVHHAVLDPRDGRTLLAFDIAGNIPAGATILSAKLTLFLSKAFAPSEQTVVLHRVLTDWGEGASDATGEEGGGANAALGDATWRHTFFNTQFWTNLGGDFAPTASANQTVADSGAFYSWGSTPEMVADVQAWLSAPASNFGWLLISNESTNGSAKRFDSRQNPIAERRPVLNVMYTMMSRISEQGENPSVKFALAQNYPNPFNPSTLISFQLARDTRSEVTLGIYDLKGQLVRQLVSGKFAAGNHQVVWDGKDDAGGRVRSGIYFYRLNAEGFTFARQLTLVR
ncbi:DNRLRE domain-containing protein [candidate division KSB1 bacterium]|nr:DNRLRE domain-containing protein [candidate division KSB1 bacterium]